MRAFQSTKNSENFETGNGIFRRKFLKNPEIVEFLKRKPFKRNFQESQEEREMERKFPVRNIRKSRFTCSIRHLTFLEIQTGVFRRMKAPFVFVMVTPI